MDGQASPAAAEKSEIVLDTDGSAELTPRAAAPIPALGLDEWVMSILARQSGGASQLALATAGFDWALHFAVAPARRALLAGDAYAIAMRAFSSAFSPTALTQNLAALERIHSPQVKAVYEAYDEIDRLVDKAAHFFPGVSQKHGELVRFAAHQWLEPFRPENYLLMNPDALARTVEENGANLMRGWRNWFADVSAKAGAPAFEAGEEPAYAVGKNLAVTEGAVVYRNELIELIQYAPKTEKVRAEPILITPAWIMKYYILDLSAHNSLVSYLVSQGFTVFMISWRNPAREDGDLSFDDYRKRGVLRALDVVSEICPDRQIHAVGYCLGGTLLSIAAAGLARDGDRRLASISLFAAQTDFRDAGELATFVDEDQLEWLEASMEEKGYLGAEQMLSAFQMLRSRDLIWRRFQRAYFYGEKEQEFDLLAWNADATRMPRRMHSEYLRKLFLNNDFAQGRFEVDGRPVAISDIRAPIFALGTEKDHVAPWRSVFKIHLFADAEVTFALTNGGHNAGVVSEPGREHRRHHIRTKQDCEHYLAPDEWLKVSEERQGSWWPSWIEWLVARSSAETEPPATHRAQTAGNLLAEENPLPPAPGAYVLERWDEIRRCD